MSNSPYQALQSIQENINAAFDILLKHTINNFTSNSEQQSEKLELENKTTVEIPEKLSYQFKLLYITNFLLNTDNNSYVGTIFRNMYSQLWMTYNAAYYVDKQDVQDAINVYAENLHTLPEMIDELFNMISLAQYESRAKERDKLIEEYYKIANILRKNYNYKIVEPDNPCINDIQQYYYNGRTISLVLTKHIYDDGTIKNEALWSCYVMGNEKFTGITDMVERYILNAVRDLFLSDDIPHELQPLCNAILFFFNNKLDVDEVEYKDKMDETFKKLNFQSVVDILCNNNLLSLVGENHKTNISDFLTNIIHKFEDDFTDMIDCMAYDKNSKESETLILHGNAKLIEDMKNFDTIHKDKKQKQSPNEQQPITEITEDMHKLNIEHIIKDICKCIIDNADESVNKENTSDEEYPSTNNIDTDDTERLESTVFP